MSPCLQLGHSTSEVMNGQTTFHCRFCLYGSMVSCKSLFTEDESLHDDNALPNPNLKLEIFQYFYTFATRIFKSYTLKFHWSSSSAWQVNACVRRDDGSPVEDIKYSSSSSDAAHDRGLLVSAHLNLVAWQWIIGKTHKERAE
jgi:hypothetical protein